MPFYRDAATFYDVMTELFEKVMAQPDGMQPLSDAKVVLRLVITAPQAQLTLDSRANPPRFLKGPTGIERADVGLRMPADVLHDTFLGKVRLRDAYLSGKIKLDSSPLRALGLLGDLTDLFHHMESLYPQVLRQRGLL